MAETGTRVSRIRKAGRITFFRYLIPAVLSFLLVILAFVPSVLFVTAAGESDAGSLCYWQEKSFSSVYAYLFKGGNKVTDTATNEFSIAVMVTTIVNLLTGVGGFFLTVGSSVTAIYLLFSKRSPEKKPKIARLFRLIFWNRGILTALYALQVIPFLYPHLLAVYYTDFLSNPAYAKPVLIDPLWVAVLFWILDIGLVLYAKKAEQKAEMDLFAPFHRSRKETLLPDKEENEAWEKAVREDAERDSGIRIGTPESENEHNLTCPETGTGLKEEKENGETIDLEESLEKNPEFAETHLENDQLDGIGGTYGAERPCAEKGRRGDPESEEGTTRTVTDFSLPGGLPRGVPCGEEKNPDGDIDRALRSLFDSGEPGEDKSESARHQKKKPRSGKS